MHKVTLLAAAAVVTATLAASAEDLGGKQQTSSGKLDPSSNESAMSAAGSALKAMRSNDTAFASPGGGGPTGTTLGTNDSISALSAMQNTTLMAPPGTETVNPPIKP